MWRLVREHRKACNTLAWALFVSFQNPTLLLPSPLLHPPPRTGALPFLSLPAAHLRRRLSAAAFGDGDDFEPGDAVDVEFDNDDEVVEIDNQKDYDVEYDRLFALSGTVAEAEEGGGAAAALKGVVSPQGWESDAAVDFRIDEDEFHKISLLDCDFFIRRAPDADDNVFDFSEMYVTPPDTDVYYIPRVLSPMPQKHIRCTKKNYGRFNVTEPIVEKLRDPLYKTEREIMKVFLTKNYENRRVDDPDFVLDFEEIYIIESKTKSITRANVVVTVPEGKNRDRRNDLLIIRDNGTTFKIIDKSKRIDPRIVLQRDEWIKTRNEMETHLSKLKDFDVSNWF